MGGQGRSVLGVGLAPLLPVGSGRVQRRLLVGALRDLAEQADVTLDDAALEALLPPSRGRLAGVGDRVRRSALRTALGQLGGVLTLKESLDQSVDAALRLEMARMALLEGLLPGRAMDVGRWMNEALGGQRHAPLGRALLRDGLTVDPELFQDGLLEARVADLIRLGDGGQVLRRFQDRLARSRVKSGG